MYTVCIRLYRIYTVYIRYNTVYGNVIYGSGQPYFCIVPVQEISHKFHKHSLHVRNCAKYNFKCETLNYMCRTVWFVQANDTRTDHKGGADHLCRKFPDSNSHADACI